MSYGIKQKQDNAKATAVIIIPVQRGRWILLIAYNFVIIIFSLFLFYVLKSLDNPITARMGSMTRQLNINLPLHRRPLHSYLLPVVVLALLALLRWVPALVPLVHPLLLMSFPVQGVKERKHHHQLKLF